MQDYSAGAPIVRDLDLQPQEIAELALQRFEIGIDPPLGELELAHRLLLATRADFRLADRKPPRDNFAAQNFRVRRCRNGTRMAHTDIASQQR